MDPTKEAKQADADASTQLDANNDEEKKEAPFKLKWNDESAEWNRIDDMNQLLTKLKNYKCTHQIHKNGSVTFYPSPFLSGEQLATKPLRKIAFEQSKQYLNIMKETQCDANKLEASFDESSRVIESPSDLHAFIVAIEIAYFMHYPLKLSPSHLWLLILQSLGMHIEERSETLRNKYVNHEGKKDLIVERAEFVKGAKNNKWDGVILEFVQQIDANSVADTVDLLECNFSNTSIVEKVAGKVAIMDIMKHYFNYSMRCGCGFPQITLDGTKQDWVALKQKLAKVLSTKVENEFGKKWGDAILPLMDRFIDVYDGRIDCLFWNSMVRRGAVAPSQGWRGVTDIGRRKDVFYSGWFNILFPFLQPQQSWWAKKENNKKIAMQGNRWCAPYSDKEQYVRCGLSGGVYGTHCDGYPLGLSSAPVKYIDLSNGKREEYKMKFIAGFIGCDQCDKTLEITPKVGWLIGEQ